jgi:hypothetical protein
MWHVCGRQTASRQGCHGVGRAPEALDDGHAALDAAVHGQHAAAQGGVRGAAQAEDLRIAGRAVERPEVVELHVGLVGIEAVSFLPEIASTTTLEQWYG